MIESIKFIESVRCFEKGFSVDFKPGVNLLVGDQGCGKSTLLNVISDKLRDKAIVRTTNDSVIKYSWFDFEKDNPRTKSSLPKENSKFLPHLITHFMSHGEMVKKMLVEKNFDDVDLILMDEPDMAMSIRSIYLLIDRLSNLSRSKQIIMSAHHPYLISSQQEVLCLEEKKGWITSNEFVKFHSNL